MFNLIRMHIAIEVIPLSYSEILALGGETVRHPGVTGICYDLERWAVQISLSALEMCGTSASTVNTFSSNFLTSCIILSPSHKNLQHNARSSKEIIKRVRGKNTPTPSNNIAAYKSLNPVWWGLSWVLLQAWMYPPGSLGLDTVVYKHNQLPLSSSWSKIKEWKKPNAQKEKKNDDLCHLQTPYPISIPGVLTK